jgi:outer membrane lipoprotein carrier protein
MPRSTRRLAPRCLTAALLWVSLPGAAAGQRSSDAALDLLEAAAERFAGVRAICADFVQEISVPLLDEEHTASGRLCQQRPNLFRMDFREPAGDQVVADGEHFWLYYPSMSPGQVVRLPVDPERGGLDFYREFLGDPAGTYHVGAGEADAVDGRATLRIPLRPREPRGYERATVWIDRETYLILRIEVEEENGTVRRVTLGGARLDPALPDDHFRFVPPAGVQIVSG